MNQRLLTTLPAVAALPAAGLATAEGRRLVADCADALRLALDCPQQALAPAQRADLDRLSALVEGDGVPAAALRAAAQAACASLGLRAAERSARAT